MRTIMIDNTNNTGHEPEYLLIFMCIIISCLGGIAKELSNFESCFNARRFFSNVFISGFCGLLVGLAAPEFEHKNLIMIAGGISGTMGISLVNYLGELFRALLHHIASTTLGHEIEIKEKAVKRLRKIKKSSK